MLDRVLGYVIAHEIGHVLLADPRHSRWGLMQAAYANVKALEDDAPVMSIDESVRERLRLRLAGVALCD
jgi:Zn-dependent protease with chaperone function